MVATPKDPYNANNITLYIGEETHPIIENKDRREGSIFKEQYKKARQLFESILDNNKSEKKVSNPYTKQRNNIIAFVGDRGSGKTSCMLSFAQMLREESKRNAEPSLIKESKCLVIDSIDPSFFEEKNSNNILELIIGRLYKLFDDTKKNEKHNNDEDDCFNPNDIRTLVQAFQTVKDSLSYLENEDKYSHNSLEDLSKLAGTDNLQRNFHKLVKDFLKFYDKKTLVISLDDIDLNTKHAFRMVEQIRKYMILPNVVFLMAIKFDQLRHVITQKMLMENKTLLAEKVISKADVDDMSEKYIEKLIPHTSRVFLPDNESYMYKKVVLKEGFNTKENLTPSGHPEPMRELIPAMIFFKCRYLFYNTKGETSPIVPRNLRELRMLIKMLYSMDDFVDIEHSKYNLREFKEYFFGTWIECIGSHYKHIAATLIAEQEPILFNKKVVQLLYLEFFTEAHTEQPYKSTDKLKAISSIDNIPYNISLGDAFAVMNHLSSIETERKAQNLFFFIKSLYSIRLYELYCDMKAEITANVKENDSEKEDTTTKKDKQSPELNKRGAIDKYSAFCQLVGGNYYELDTEEIISKNQDKHLRQRWMLNGKKLIKLIDEIEQDFKDLKEKTPNEEIKNIANKIDKKKLQIAEALMLMTSRHAIRKNPGIEIELSSTDYRKFQPTYYTKNLREIQNMQVDMLSPLFNVLDFELCYSRFSPEGTIYKIAKNHDESIYSLMRKDTEKRVKKWGENEVNEGHFLQLASLRNSEVIDNLLSYLIGKREQFSKAKNLDRIPKFYTTLGDFTLEMYKKSSDEISCINLSLFKKLAEAFKNLNETDKADEAYITTLDQILESNRLRLAPTDRDKTKVLGDGQTMLANVFSDRLIEHHPDWENKDKQEILDRVNSIGGRKPIKVWEDLYTELYKEFENKKRDNG